MVFCLFFIHGVSVHLVHFQPTRLLHRRGEKKKVISDNQTNSDSF